MKLIDYALCPHCDALTPIRPATPLPEGGYQKWKETDGVSQFFLCRQCNRVAEMRAERMLTRASTHVFPLNHEDAQIRVFEIAIECETENCKSRGVLFVAWNSHTTGEELQKASTKWILADMLCPSGHPFLWPPWTANTEL